MKELRDKDFDQLFKTRITIEIPEFEEESWSKMERKLRRRDRQIFYRNASIILLVLSFGLGFYYISNVKIDKQKMAAANEKETKESARSTGTFAVADSALPKLADPSNDLPLTEIVNTNTSAGYQVQQAVYDQQATQLYEHINELQQVKGPRLAADVISSVSLDIREERSQIAPIVAKPADENIIDTRARIKLRRKIPISLALVVGPDFNSTTTAIGGKANVAFGVGVGIGLTKKLSVQTGINYGHKNYNANADNYTFNNANTKYTIAEVNAACKVIEIPLRASLNISENPKRSFEVNAGLSSYIMLKESYLYKYTEASGRADRLVEATNENKHLLSVVDLSASYNIKLKNKKLALGIEPYIKIPLTGIGVGSVPLKSSGISLKLRYDFNEN